MDKRFEMTKSMVNFLEGRVCALKIFKEQIKDIETKKAYEKEIRETQKAIENIKSIKHEQLLITIFNAFVGRYSQFLSLLSTVINTNVEKFDKNEEDFAKFVEIRAKAYDQLVVKGQKIDA